MEWNNFKKEDAGCDKYGKQRLELAVYLRDNILNKFKDKYFIENGTLLGAFRKGEFIPHDDDFDYAFLIENYCEIEELNKYINDNLDSKYECRIIDSYAKKLEIYDPSYGLYTLLGPSYKNNNYHYVTIDIQFYIKEGNNYRCLYEGKKESDLVDEYIIYPLKQIKLEREYFNCPNKTEDFLIINYGSIKEGAIYNNLSKKYE